MGGGGKSQTSTQSVSIPPEVLARYNSVNAQAQTAAATPFSQYGGEFVAPITATQQAGVSGTNAAANQAQPYYNAATSLTAGADQNVGPLTQGQIGYYQNPYTQAVVNPTVQALQQQQGQQLSQQQAQAIQSGAFGGDRSNLARAQLQGQQNLALGQAIAPLYQQGYTQAANLAAGQQGVVASDLARQMQAAQQIANLGTGAQSSALQGAQAQLSAGAVPQQTQQAQDTALYQQFQQQQGYPFQVAQFLANIAEGTGALSGSTTTTTSPAGFFSDERLKTDIKRIGKTNDGQPIYSYKYKGEDRTQIGLMAQDVEKKHPSAVGLLGGYKTVDYKKATEGAERPAKFAGGGLVPEGFDYNSMGGAVMPDMEGEGFAHGGEAIGPWANAGLYGNQKGYVPGAMKNPHPHHFAMGGTPYAGGYVPDAGPQQQRQLMLPPKLAAAPATGLSSAMQTGKNIQGMYNFGKAGLMGSAPTEGDPSGAAGLIGGQGKMSGQNVFSQFKDWATSDPTKAEGGLIVHRDHYESGGDVDPYEDTKDPLGDVLKTQESSKRNSLSLPGQGPSGGQSGAGQLSSALGLGKGLMDFGSAASDFFSAAPEVMAGLLASGGTVDRRHFADGGGSLVPDALQQYLSASSGPQPNQLNPSYNLDDGTQLRGLGVFSGSPDNFARVIDSATYGAGLGIGDPNRSGRFNIDVSRQSAPGSHPQYGGKASYVKSFAEGGLIPRQAHADGDRVLPLSQDVVNAAPGLVPPDATIDQPTGIPAEAKGLVVDQKPADTNTLFSNLEDKYGLPSGYLNRTWQIESTSGKKMENPDSNARGHFQFIPGTQKMMGLKDPYDLAESADAAARYAAQNKELLKNNGIDNPTAAQLYLAHQQGGLGALRLMNSTDRPASNAVGSDAAIALNGGDPTMSGSAFANKTMAMFDKTQGAPARSLSDVPRPPGVMGGTPTPRTDSDGSGLIDKVSSPNFVVPALGFLGSMLASQRPTLGGALGEGLLGGTGAYMAQQKQAAELPKVAAQTQLEQANAARVNMMTRSLRAGMLLPTFQNGVGLMVIDKENPYAGMTRVTDADGNPLPGYENLMSEIQKGGTGTGVLGAQPGAQPAVTGVPVSKSSDISKIIEAPTNASAWTPTIAVPKGYVPANQARITMKDPATGDMTDIAKSAYNTGNTQVAALEQKAMASGPSMLELERIINEYNSLPQTGWLSPGSGAEARTDLIRKANAALVAIGAQPINPDAVGNAEALKKGTFKLGAEVASAIGTREPGFIVSQSVQNTPGMDMSKKGFDLISSGLEQSAAYANDRAKFYRDYLSKFNHLDGAQQAFDYANPAQMYADKAILNTIPPSERQKLSSFVASNKNGNQADTQEAIRRFEKTYSKGSAAAVLGR
jgi:hypothetical protein